MSCARTSFPGWLRWRPVRAALRPAAAASVCLGPRAYARGLPGPDGDYDAAERDAVQEEGRGTTRSPMCPICGQTDRSRGGAAGCRVCREFLEATDGRDRGWF